MKTSQCHPQTKTITVSAETIFLRDVRVKMKKSLDEWGVSEQNDVEFRRKAIEFAVEAVIHANEKAKFALMEQIKREAAKQNNDFPTDPILAIQHVLHSELSGSENNDREHFIVNDTLNLNFAPNYVKSDTETGGTIICRKPEYERYSKAQINPFSRFEATWYKPKEYFYKIWKDNPDTFLAGTIFEALVACHITNPANRISCISCARRNVLRWNGGWDLGSSWADVICIKCCATFEIKSKKDSQKIQTSMIKFNNMRGGSFRAYHQQQQHVHSHKQRYLVVVSRAASSALTKAGIRNNYHPVYIAKIDKVYPQLADKSFIKDGLLRMISEIKVVKPGTWTPWVYVPFCNASHIEMAQTAFDAYYGAGSWDAMGAAPPPPTTTPTVLTNNNDKTTEPKDTAEQRNNIEELRRTLEALDVDDWENGYDSD